LEIWFIVEILYRGRIDARAKLPPHRGFGFIPKEN
jgi:hypothetical protein